MIITNMFTPQLIVRVNPTFALFQGETLSKAIDLGDLTPPAQQLHGNQAQEASVPDSPNPFLHIRKIPS
jgi:hypothetical protein